MRIVAFELDILCVPAVMLSNSELRPSRSFETIKMRTFILASLAVSAQATQIYLSPAPASALRTSAREATEVISHHLALGFDEPSHDSQWVQQLGYDRASPFEQKKNDGALLVLISHSEGQHDFLPNSLQQPALTVSSSPSLQSWEALLNLYLKRAAQTFNLHLSEIHGVEEWTRKIVTESKGQVEGWLKSAAKSFGVCRLSSGLVRIR